MFDDKQQQASQGNNSPNIGRDFIINKNTIVNSGSNIVKSVSFVGVLIQSIIPHIRNEQLEVKPLINKYKIIKKIDYNGLIKYKSIVLDLGRYEGSIEDEFEQLEVKIPGIRSRFLEYINKEYIKIVSEDKIADEIFEQIIDILKTNYFNSSLNDGKAFMEDICHAGEYLVSRAFTKCKVLEPHPEE